MHGRLSQFNSLGRIGEGTYGVVLKCQHKLTGQLVAIKKFKDTEDDEQVRKTAMREVKVLQHIRHDNIVRLLEFFRMHKKLYLVFEFVEGTVLQELERSPNGLGDAATRKIMWQLVKATEHLHASKIVHRDIKPENMLLSSSGLLKLCDFGFARYLSSAAVPGDMSDYVATRWYRAPELLVGDRNYGPPVDIWAIGCMVVEMQTGQPLFPGASDIDQLWLIVKTFTEEQINELRTSPLFQKMRIPEPHERETLDQRFPFLEPEILEFLKACLHPIPAKRATCWRLLHMTYFYGAASWFPQHFFPTLGDRLAVRQAMSVERQRGKLRRPKRKADAQSSFMAQALNISPCREPRGKELLSSRLSGLAYQASPMQTDSCMEPLPIHQRTPSHDTEVEGIQPSCSITLPKELEGKGNVVHLDARAGPASEASMSIDSGNLELSSANNGATASSQDRGNEAESLQLGRRRSQRLKGQQRSWQPQQKWQDHRSGSQFLSPEPRGMRQQRERRQPTIFGKPSTSSPSRQNGPALNQQSPSKHGWKEESWNHTPASRGRARGRGVGPSRSRASLDVRMANCDESVQQGIPAHYGRTMQSSPACDNGDGSVHPWVQKGWVAPGGTHSSQNAPQGLPTQRRCPGASELSFQAAHAEASDGHQPKSPLRAHAPVFVPQALQSLQGKKLELCQH